MDGGDTSTRKRRRGKKKKKSKKAQALDIIGEDLLDSPVHSMEDKQDNDDMGFDDYSVDPKIVMGGRDHSQLRSNASHSAEGEAAVGMEPPMMPETAQDNDGGIVTGFLDAEPGDNNNFGADDKQSDGDDGAFF